MNPKERVLEHLDFCYRKIVRGAKTMRVQKKFKLNIFIFIFAVRFLGSEFEFYPLCNSLFLECTYSSRNEFSCHKVSVRFSQSEPDLFLNTPFNCGKNIYV